MIMENTYWEETLHFEHDDKLSFPVKFCWLRNQLI